MEELGESDERAGPPERQRQDAPGWIGQEAWLGQPDVSASGLQLAAAGGEHVLHPLDVRPVPEPDDIVVPAPQDEERRPIQAPGAPSGMGQYSNPGSRPATSRVTGLKRWVVSEPRTLSRVRREGT